MVIYNYEKDNTDNNKNTSIENKYNLRYNKDIKKE